MDHGVGIEVGGSRSSVLSGRTQIFAHPPRISITSTPQDPSKWLRGRGRCARPEPNFLRRQALWNGNLFRNEFGLVFYVLRSARLLSVAPAAWRSCSLSYRSPKHPYISQPNYCFWVLGCGLPVTTTQPQSFSSGGLALGCGPRRFHFISCSSLCVC